MKNIFKHIKRLAKCSKVRAFAGILLCIGIIFLLFKIVQNTIRSYQTEYERAISNEKALILELSQAKEDNRVLQLRAEQLSYFKDSITKEMINIKEDLKIKDKQLKSIYYLSYRINKRDTVIFKDTVINYKVLQVDTLIKEAWYSLDLKLEYPNKVIVNPEFKSDLFIYQTTQKETIKPPKKFFLCRLFQKKHKVIRVHIVEKSPYVNIEKTRFIDIIP